MTDKIKNYWNYRSNLGKNAGSGDLIAKMLEMRAMFAYLKDGIRIAEFGCGNGITAIEIAKNFNVELTCFDFSPDMIAAAQSSAKEAGVENSIKFQVADVREHPVINETFDIVITERMIINLSDWDEQSRAIEYLTGLLSPGGRYLMCENSLQGLSGINSLRVAAQLQAISPPWHNVYLDDDKVALLRPSNSHLETIVPYSSTYYFLSRVINAWLAAQEGKDPSYDAPVNQLALLLPSEGNCSQGKLWIWLREEE